VQSIYQTFTENWIIILPELLLLGVAALSVLGGLWVRSRDVWAVICLTGLIVGMLILVTKIPSQWPPQWIPSASLFMTDELRVMLRGFSFFTGMVLLLLCWTQARQDYSPEFYACLLGAIAGIGMAIAAYDLVALFLALETVSIPTYIGLYILRRDNPGLEATVKYFLLSIFSSGIFLFGISLLYFEAGSTNYLRIQLALAQGADASTLLLSGVLVIAGLSFRIAAVPFHFYAPDVFVGTHPAGAAFLAVVPKIVGIISIMQLLTEIYSSAVKVSPAEVSVLQVLLVALGILAAASMVLGNIAGLLQTELYRLLAYSSIAHAGYMLVGLAAGSDGTPVSGYQAVVFYLGTYLLMTIGTFAGLLCVRQDGKLLTHVDELSGLAQVRPGLALLLAVGLFSLVGLPPTAGFWGKVNLFLAAWYAPGGRSLLRFLAVFLAINAAVGAWYYLRVIGIMYLRQPIKPFDKVNDWPALLACSVCTVLTVVLFFVPGLWWKPIENAFGMIR
jgi:NADH-quinone oxidoreductase subunit N